MCARLECVTGHATACAREKEKAPKNRHHHLGCRRCVIRASSCTRYMPTMHGCRRRRESAARVRWRLTFAAARNGLSLRHTRAHALHSAHSTHYHHSFSSRVTCPSRACPLSAPEVATLLFAHAQHYSSV